jgi:hypothetical protein
MEAPRWGPSPRAARTIGLGDVVHMVVRPITGAIDAVAHTQLSHCLSCGERHLGLNRRVPDVLRPLRRKRKR